MMKQAVKAFLALVFVFTGFTGAQAQLVIDDTMTPEQLVQNVLLGQGVTASNITYNGAPGTTLTEQVAGFDATAAQVGLPAGVILATGDADLAIGPNDEGGATLGGGNIGQSDPDLATISGQNINDAAVLEFDFVPSGDTLKFRYVFGSDEYLEYVGSINDVFGFFLSGPGINGPYQNNAENIALIPGTTSPVSINSVNDVMNPLYYIDNGDGFTPPFNTDVTVVQYDGITVVLEAVAIVQCGQTYHIKLAIGDASDDILDSGVFLEAGSFQSNSIQVNVTTVTGDNTLVEGCFDATFTFERPDTAGDLWINYDLGGNAIEGTDFAFIPDSILIAAGTDSSALVVSPFADGIAEGVDSLTITVYTVNVCGDTLISSATIYIVDTLEIVSNTPDIYFTCPLDSVTVSALASNGVPPYTYSWDNGENGPSFNIATPGSAQTYIVTITDSCQNYQTVDTVLVVPDLQPDPTVSASPDTAICPGSTVTLSATVSGGSNPLSYSWSNGGNSNSISVTPGTTTTYTVTITDSCGRTSTSDVTVNILTPASLVVTAPDDMIICSYQDATLIPAVQGGMGTPSLSWTGTAPFENIGAGVITTQPGTEGIFNFILTATDACGNTSSDDVNVIVEACDVTIPNVFSPNGDGYNDFFVILNIEKFPTNTVTIVNRWGKEIYQKSGYDNTWSGDKFSDGTYYYIVDLDDGSEPRTGTFNLLRK